MKQEDRDADYHNRDDDDDGDDGDNPMDGSGMREIEVRPQTSSPRVGAEFG